MMKKRNAGFACAFVPLAAGCYSPQAIPVINYDSVSLKQDIDGCRVAIEPYDTSKECNVFNNDVRARGYLPIQVYIQNCNDLEELIFNPEAVSFIDNTGINWQQVNGMRMAQSFHRIPEVEGLAIGVISPIMGLGFAMGARDYNTRIDADYASKQVKEQELIIPGSNVNGFVYFRVPEEDDKSKSEVLKRLKNGTIEVEVFEREEGTKRFSFLVEANKE